MFKLFKPTAPKLKVRSAKRLDNLALYYAATCPYCRMVIKQLDRMGIELHLRNIHQKTHYKKELIAEGGKKTVPCLRIEATNENNKTMWMYESFAIIEYLKKHRAVE